MSKVARIRRLSQYVVNRELRFNAESARLPHAGRSTRGFSHWRGIGGLESGVGGQTGTYHFAMQF